jgi:S1-C subfamily serine protease
MSGVARVLALGTLAILGLLAFYVAAPSAFARGKGGTSGIDWHCVPSFGEQKLVGMKCTGIRSGSILHKAGIVDGDILTSVDGKPTLSPRDMMGAVRDLKEADHAQLKVLRGGKEQTLSYVK